MTMTTRIALTLLCYVLLSVHRTWSYPLIAEVPEGESKCFNFNIPRDDDAHMVFLTIPGSTSAEVEEWYVQQLYALTKLRGEVQDGSLPKRIPERPPGEIQTQLDDFFSGGSSGNRPMRNSNVMLKVLKPKLNRPVNQRQMMWFQPVVMNHLEKFMNRHQRGGTSWEPKNSADGYSICFENLHGTNTANVIFEIVLVSMDVEEEEEEGDGSVQKKHLTPLEQQLSQSINAANSILNEMRYMEKRESRMRQTADSINSRVRMFSYISVGVLLLVTYMQVTYLKRYFKKKKLM